MVRVFTHTIGLTCLHTRINFFRAFTHVLSCFYPRPLRAFTHARVPRIVKMSCIFKSL